MHRNDLGAFCTGGCLLDAVAHRHVDAAIAASDELIDFVDSMFDVLEREIDPALLDCSLDYLDSI